MEAHSVIGASSAYRWINCPGSVRLYRQLTERRATEYASAGTAAHELAEKCLRDGSEPGDHLGEIIVADGKEFPVDEATAASVSVYVETVRRDHDRFGGTLNIEQPFSLEWLYPGMFGRNDASLVPDSVFGDTVIFDYMHGRKAVAAAGNPQCMYYALGALGERNPMMSERVICKIIQPNCWGKDPVDEWEVSAKDLYDWGHTVLKPAAVRTQEPDAPCVSGEWCCFCEAAGICPARRQEALAMLDETGAQTAPVKLPEPESLTPAEIGRASAFFTSDAFASWVKALAATELALLQKGVDVPGRKLVETVVRGNRRWADDGAAIAALKSECGEELFEQPRLKSPAQVEKVLRARKMEKPAREELLASLTTRDETVKTIVVPAEDERPSVTDRKQDAVELFD